MRYRKLGRTNIDVSVVCMGGWSIVSEDFTWGVQDVGHSLAAIRASLEAGVNFFDTAEGYGAGQSEEILAEGIGARRRDVIIASKVSSDHLEPGTLRRRCEESLRRLRTDYIDLYQIHWPSRQRPIAETLGVLEQLKAEGKIRMIGLSNFGVSFMRELPAGAAESNQVCYSLLWRAIEHEVQPMCLELGMSILCYSPLSQGLLTGKFRSPDEVPPGRARTRLFSRDRPESRHSEAGCEKETFDAIADIRGICKSIGLPMGQAALAWLMAQPGVTSVIAGARNAAQAAQNAAAGDVELAPEVAARLAAATEKVKSIIGPNADMWQTDSRMERQ